MLICPQCRTSYSSAIAETCYRDGRKLVDYDAFVAAERDPLRGRMIRGLYRITERIGQGGMGTVYRATQVELRRDVAIKILRAELAGDPDTVARFQREAKATSRLTHPNTVRVFDYGQTEDGLLYLVMELLEGELITEQLMREGPLDPGAAIRTTQQILRSLAEAHTKGIVHRDLKPDNIFVARVAGHTQSVVKVLDFGIAKIVGADHRVDQFETQAGTVFGTPRFMSPEQAQGAALDGRSDLYSVGAMLYQMLTGRAPFTDDDAVVVMAKHIRELPVPPQEAAPTRAIPPSLNTVVMRALQKDPATRFQDAIEFDTALETCLDDVVNGRTGPRRVASAPGRLKGALLVVIALTVAGLGAYFATGDRLHALAGPFIGTAPRSAGAAQETPAPSDSGAIDSGLRAAPPARVEAAAADIRPLATTEGLEEADAGATAGGPAVVTIRSEPSDAEVYRGGQLLGETPIKLIVQPDEELVRVELKLAGYQPLAAELTATDGERLLLLTKDDTEPERSTPAAKRRPPVGRLTAPTARTQPTSLDAAASADEATTEPRPITQPAADAAAPDVPYERFE